MPSCIYPLGTYYDALREMAWAAAGWASRRVGDELHVWGPISIMRSVDVDIARLGGCLDSNL